MGKRKLMVHDFLRMKQEGRKITWITSYDYPTAQFAEAAEIELRTPLPLRKQGPRCC